MGEWMVRRSSGIRRFEEALRVSKEARNILYVVEVFEKTRCLSKQAHSYFFICRHPYMSN